MRFFPSEPYKRSLFKVFVNYFIFVIILTHYAVTLWIYVGDKYFFESEVNEPWIIANPEFLDYSDF